MGLDQQNDGDAVQPTKWTPSGARSTFTLKNDHPMTVRQVYYQLVSQGVIDKTEAEYKGTVCRLLVQMRKANLIPFDWIADNTRWMRKPNTYGSLGEMLQITRGHVPPSPLVEPGRLRRGSGLRKTPWPAWSWKRPSPGTCR